MYFRLRRTQGGMQPFDIALLVVHPSVATTGISIPWFVGTCLKFVIAHLYASRGR
jgi:hypothetical protein